MDAEAGSGDEPVVRSPKSASTPARKSADRHAQLLVDKRSLGAGARVVFLGDSITECWLTDGARSWARFADLLPVNLGLGRDWTEHLLWRVQHGAVDGLAPSLVVLMIGSNNFGHACDERPEWVAAGVSAIVGELRHRLPDARLLLLAVLPRAVPGDPATVLTRVRATNTQLAALADEVRAGFADLGFLFLNERGEVRPDLMPDGQHLSPEGYAEFYAALRPLIDDILATTPG